MADATLTTNYRPDRTLVQSIPGASGAAGGGGDLSAGLLALLRARRALAGQSPAGQTIDTGAASMSAPRNYGGAPAGNYRPSFGASGSGAAPKPKEITRVVADPFASPYTKMATGFDPGARVERYIPGVGWEFEDLRPHGTSGGIIGGGMSNPSSLHSSSSEGGAGPANPNDANRDAFDTKTGMMRSRADVEPLTGMQRTPAAGRNAWMRR